MGVRPAWGRKEMKMAKRGKRRKRRLAKLRKKLGFVPNQVSMKSRFGPFQERLDTHGKANTLGKTKREIQQQLDRKNKQKGWSDG